MSKTIPYEALALHDEYVCLHNLKDLRVSLPYASVDNVLGRILYPDNFLAYLHKDAATKLSKANALLKLQHPHLSLLILDALRPNRTQEILWAAVVGSDEEEYVANPISGSIHSFGMAIDLTLFDERTQKEVWMGTGFDDFSLLSQPQLETQFIASGELSPQALQHREILRQVMNGAGFKGLNNEWWHFDAGMKHVIRKNMLKVL